MTFNSCWQKVSIWVVLASKLCLCSVTMLPEAENILSDAVEDAGIQRYFCASSDSKGREEIWSFHHCRILTLRGGLGLPKQVAISNSIGGFSTAVSPWLLLSALAMASSGSTSPSSAKDAKKSELSSARREGAEVGLDLNSLVHG